MIKGVFFDVGGTLYSYDQYPDVMESVCSQVADRFSISRSVSELGEYLGRATQKIDLQMAGRSFYLFRRYFEEISKEFLQSVTSEGSYDDVLWCASKMEYGLCHRLELKPDCLQTLASVKALGLYTSVVSNSDINQLDILIERGNLSPYFDDITSSEAAQSCKPDQQFFSLALEKSKLEPHEVLFVGDSIEQDIVGAQASEMRTVLISEEGMITPLQLGGVEVEPEFSVSSLSEILTVLDDCGVAQRH